MDIKSYIEANKARFREELFSLIRIPSISSDSSRKADMEACAARWRELLLAAGVDHAYLCISGGVCRENFGCGMAYGTCLRAL